MRKRILVIAPLAVAGVMLFVTLGGLLVQGLWNSLLPQVFGWRPVTFWQALGLLLLCRILFGGRSGHGYTPSRVRRRIAERWEQMTPEERERFRHGILARCGFVRPGSNSEER